MTNIFLNGRWFLTLGLPMNVDDEPDELFGWDSRWGESWA